MLPYLLSILVGIGSVGMYLAALFVPEIYRRSDPLWSGVGLFYGLVLWVEAGQLSGGLLLGQALSVLLLGWFVGQTLLLRRQAAAPPDRTILPEPLEKLCAAVLSNPPEETAWIEIRQEFPPPKTLSDRIEE
jgi:Ycf66 protein N-terminus